MPLALALLLLERRTVQPHAYVLMGGTPVPPVKTAGGRLIPVHSRPLAGEPPPPNAHVRQNPRPRGREPRGPVKPRRRRLRGTRGVEEIMNNPSGGMNPPSEKLIPPSGKLNPPSERMNPPSERSVHPEERSGPPSEKTNPPSERFVHPRGTFPGPSERSDGMSDEAREPRSDQGNGLPLK